MTWPLRQSTASQEIPLGPFVDDTDGKTAETALTIANTDIKIQKFGATSQTNKNSGGATHIATGDYYAVLDATDSDTVGPMRVKVHVAGALPVWLDCMVFEEAVYDDLYAASAPGYLKPTVAGRTLDVASTGEAGIDLANIALPAGAIPSLGIVDNGTAQSATGTTLVLRSAAGFADDELIGATILITGGSTGVGQRALITDYTGSSDTATVGTWTTTPTGTITYVIFGTAAGSGGGSGATAAEIADAVWDEPTTGHTTSGTFGEQCKTDIDGIKTKTDFLPSATAGAAGGVFIAGTNAATAVTTSFTATFTGNVTGSVGSVAAGGITAASIASDAFTAAKFATDSITKIQNGLSTAATLALVKTVTDNLATAYELDGATYRFTANALEQAPSGTGASAVAIADEVQTRTIAAVTMVNGLAANTVNAAALDATAVAEIQSGLATSTALATVAGYLDTEIPAILEDTGTTIPALISALNNITVADVLAGIVEGTVTVQQALRLSNAALAGKASGLDTTTVKYRDLADTKDRITASVDDDGNRNTVTLDVT